VPELHRRAAGWFAGAGWVVAASRHALAANDDALLSEIVAHGWVEQWLSGGVPMLRSLVGALPPAAIERDPELRLAAATIHIEDGELDVADAALERAVAEVERVPARRRRQFRAACGVLMMRRARLHGHVDEALPEAQRLIGDDVASLAAPGLSALALATLGIGELWAGDQRVATQRLEAAIDAGRRSGHRYVVALSLAHLALQDSLAGRHRRAFDRARGAVDIVERLGWTRTSAAAASYGVLAGIEFLRDEPAAAQRTLERAGVALEAAPDRGLRAIIAANRVRILAALGDVDGAYAALQFERLALGDFRHPQVSAILVAQEGLLLEALGERAQARAVLAAAVVESGAPEVRVALARLRLADGLPGEALALAAPVAAGPPDGRLLSTRVQAHAVEALAHDALLDHDAAGAALRVALDLAEPRGMRRMLTELGPALRPALHRELRRETAHRALVEELLEALDGRAHDRPARQPSEPLSDRELTILRFLPTMMSNQEIADELFVSVNTLKTHLKHIYRKLDVASRRDAVERGRDMELLTPSARGPRDG
jgi:LuxR family maltose regulon positive regulatory protein